MATTTMQAKPEHSASAAIRAQWDAAAIGWDAHRDAIHAWLAEPSAKMFELAGVAPGGRVLDIAAGAGDQTLALAERVGPQGRVVATDLSPELVARLRQNAARAGLETIDARVADAEAPLAERAAFDAAICRMGLMLMTSPARCIAATAAALRPGAAFCAMTFAGPEKNPCIRILMATALRHAGLPPRDPATPGGLLSLGDPARAAALFREGGLREVETIEAAAPFRLPSVEQYMDFIRASAAPIRGILARLAPAARDAAFDDMRRQLDGFSGPTGWEGPNTLLLTVGRA